MYVNNKTYPVLDLPSHGEFVDEFYILVEKWPCIFKCLQFIFHIVNL